MQYTHKKSLGQHFLHDESICKEIVASLHPNTKHLIEIGPGAGALTKYLIQHAWEDFYCIELDREKVLYLEQTIPGLKGKIRELDFLEAPKPGWHNFSVIGNFPYNISSQIVFKLLEWRDAVDEVVGMFQKEVAVRIASKEGNKDYGILSVLTQCYFELEYLMDVPPHCFTPAPKVMSGVIRMRRREQPLFDGDYDAFRKFIKVCFNQRRKTLRNGLKSFLPADQLTDSIFDKRAEQLSVSDFIALYNTRWPAGKKS